MSDLTVAADALTPPAVVIEPAASAPARRLQPDQLKLLGQNLQGLFQQYVNDRRIAELKWLKNLRQYLGILDPEIEQEISPQRSKAYPRITRVKCISVLSRLMNLMFPGNERNWQLCASPSPDMDPEDVQLALQQMLQRFQAQGLPAPEVDEELVEQAVKRLADARAEELMELIDDQLQELGGDQTLDYIALNRQVLASGIVYGLGVLTGPFARECTTTRWGLDPLTGRPMPTVTTHFKPQFEHLSIWDYYPDMAAKRLRDGDGWFERRVMSRAQVRELANRSDFFGDIIKRYLSRTPVGNYKAQPHEIELRSMGVKVNVNEMKTETSKYELLIWRGPVSGEQLLGCGVEVPLESRGDDIEADVWLLDGHVIKADINAWRKLGLKVRQVHEFIFDQDDTAPWGNGLPNVMRDSQMSVAAATRMLLDNASVVCGPNIEVNTELLRPDQDISSITAYKVWYREGLGADANVPAVRNIPIDAHLEELLKVIELFMQFADTETFVGPATGGDQPAKGMTEPMRTAAGASMLRGDAALPFKDIVRNFDSFTQSVIYSLVQFNKKFNPGKAQEGDYDVIARGATSLIAKEIRGMQVDQLAATLTPAEALHVDERKLAEARLKVRDLGDLLVPADEAARRKQAQDQQTQTMLQQQLELTAAQVRKALADAYKGITQGNKNSAAADAETVNTALAVLEQGVDDETGGPENDQAPAGRPPAGAE